MNAVVMPFPLASRRAFIVRHARYGATLEPAAFEKYLARQLMHQADVMRKRGIADVVVQREIANMHRSICVAVWDTLMLPSGGFA